MHKYHKYARRQNLVRQFRNLQGTKIGEWAAGRKRIGTRKRGKTSMDVYVGFAGCDPFVSPRM